MGCLLCLDQLLTESPSLKFEWILQEKKLVSLKLTGHFLPSGMLQAEERVYEWHEQSQIQDALLSLLKLENNLPIGLAIQIISNPIFWPYILEAPLLPQLKRLAVWRHMSVNIRRSNNPLFQAWCDYFADNFFAASSYWLACGKNLSSSESSALDLSLLINNDPLLADLDSYLLPFLAKTNTKYFLRSLPMRTRPTYTSIAALELSTNESSSITQGQANFMPRHELIQRLEKLWLELADWQQSYVDPDIKSQVKYYLIGKLISQWQLASHLLLSCSKTVFDVGALIDQFARLAEEVFVYRGRVLSDNQSWCTRALQKVMDLVGRHFPKWVPKKYRTPITFMRSLWYDVQHHSDVMEQSRVPMFNTTQPSHQHHADTPEQPRPLMLGFFQTSDHHPFHIPEQPQASMFRLHQRTDQPSRSISLQAETELDAFVSTFKQGFTCLLQQVDLLMVKVINCDDNDVAEQDITELLSSTEKQLKKVFFQIHPDKNHGLNMDHPRYIECCDDFQQVRNIMHALTNSDSSGCGDNPSTYRKVCHVLEGTPWKKLCEKFKVESQAIVDNNEVYLSLNFYSDLMEKVKKLNERIDRLELLQKQRQQRDREEQGARQRQEEQAKRVIVERNYLFRLLSVKASEYTSKFTAVGLTPIPFPTTPWTEEVVAEWLLAVRPLLKEYHQIKGLYYEDDTEAFNIIAKFLPNKPRPTLDNQTTQMPADAAEPEESVLPEERAAASLSMGTL